MGNDGVQAMSRRVRFSLSAPPLSDGTAVVTGGELRHLRYVARMREGSEVSLLGPNGVEYAGRIERFEDDRALVRITAQAAAAPRVRLVLAAAVIKGPRMDFMVEKAAELGASELWPVICARGVVRDPGRERLERWRRLALAAAKQSLSPTTMEVRAPMAFADMVRAVPGEALAVVCMMGAQALTALLRARPPHALLIACGPEGDFDESEVAIARGAGFAAASVGPNRLRSETAAMAAVSIAASSFEEFRGGN
jgi:16S rRNA (uracil1498-N3)-methyltransferase